MTTFCDFKLLETDEIYPMRLLLNSRICDIFPRINYHLLQLLHQPSYDYFIQIFSLNMITIDPHSTQCFTTICDSTIYPAFYFKVLPIRDPNSDTDSDTDSIPPLLSVSDDDMDYQSPIIRSNVYNTNSNIYILPKQ